MSVLQRRLQHASGNSRSRSASRTPSGNVTPQHGYDSDSSDDEYMSNSYLSPTSVAGAEALAESIESLLASQASQEQAAIDAATKSKNKIQEILDTLETDRRNTSLEAREQALVQFIKIFSQKYEPEKFEPQFCSALARAFLTARSELERFLAIQALCVAGTVDIDDLSEELPPVFEKLVELIKDENENGLNVSSKANLAVGYSFLKYILSFGGGAYGIEDIISTLVTLASELTADDAPLASALLGGSGLLLTLLQNPNISIDENIATVIDILNEGAPLAKLAGGKVLALYYQNYDYENTDDSEDDEELESIPFVDDDELEKTLKELIGQSSKRISKKTRKEQRSLLRDVQLTVRIFSSSESRKDIKPDDLLITHLKLSRSKSLTIDSWAKLILVQHLKWTFGPGIHTQIANNPFVKELVDSTTFRLPSNIQFGGSTTDTSIAEKSYRSTTSKPLSHSEQELRRDKYIKTQRKEKQIDQGIINS